MQSFEASMAVFFLNVSVVVALWLVLVRRYIWPWLSRHSLEQAVVPLLIFSTLRVNGLCMLLPGVVSPDIPPAFASAVAYGDVAAALLAVGAIAAFGRSETAGRIGAWLYTVIGLADLAIAGTQMVLTGVAPAHLRGAYFLVVVMVPSLVIVHLLIFYRLRHVDSFDRASVY